METRQSCGLTRGAQAPPKAGSETWGGAAALQITGLSERAKGVRNLLESLSIGAVFISHWVGSGFCTRGKGVKNGCSTSFTSDTCRPGTSCQPCL